MKEITVPKVSIPFPFARFIHPLFDRLLREQMMMMIIIIIVM
jgi:hypothetical protein